MSSQPVILGTMSYNLAFWMGGDNDDPGVLYARMNADEPVSDVAPVDHDRVVQAFVEDLADWSWDGQFLRPPGVDPGGTPAFDVSIGDQMVEFVGYQFQGELANRIIDAMNPLGYRLFDPQTGERFA